FEFQKKLWEEKDLYIGQLEYMNRRITEAVDRILAESKTPPIIIIQSDHGPNLQRGLSKKAQKSVRFKNFAAYYLPNAPKGFMTDVKSPVNQFRYIFNHYFQAGLEILPDRHYYSEYG